MELFAHVGLMDFPVVIIVFLLGLTAGFAAGLVIWGPLRRGGGKSD